MSKTKIGTLLKNALVKVSDSKSESNERMIAANYGGKGKAGKLPIILKPPTIKSKKGEDWQEYKTRVQKYLEPLNDKIIQLVGGNTTFLITANAIQTEANAQQIKKLSETKTVKIDKIELDPLVQLADMDDAIDDIGLPTFRKNHPDRDGKGVKVAVLDSGIDIHHPNLTVSKSKTTCEESINIPGSHGTHCAGSIASNDNLFAGVAPEVELFNIKVLRADGSGQHTFITKGIDEALDLEANILSMSLGFNHLPTWFDKGHGWVCNNGRCPLCVAVDNASRLDNTFVVVAAGNDHSNAEQLRSLGFGKNFDTELGCPGQAREAVTVGAITKNTHFIANFSSRGPSSYGSDKPDLCGPGVNITSTVPIPRNSSGKPVPSPPRNKLFGRKSGTSMATPIVAGVAALVIQDYIVKNKSWTPKTIKNKIIKNYTAKMNFPINAVGNGRIRF